MLGTTLVMNAYDSFVKILRLEVPNLKTSPLEYVLDHFPGDLPENGVVLECGVHSGASIRKISAAPIFQNTTVYGFDSFEGLPERWDRNDMDVDKGAFNLDGKLPDVPSNVELVPGWFDDTLPSFAKRVEGESKLVTFIHVDCDLYSSTKTIFDSLGHLFCDGIVIVFDELFNYNNFSKHELLALWEFCKTNGWRIEWIGKNGTVLVNATDNGAWDQPAAVRLWKLGEAPPSPWQDVLDNLNTLQMSVAKTINDIL